MKIYSDIIKELRKDHKLTQKQMGSLFGIAGSTYAMYENGGRRLSIEMLCGLADILGTSTDYILDRTDKVDPYPNKRHVPLELL